MKNQFKLTMKVEKLVSGHTLTVESANIFIRGNLMCGSGFPTTPAGSFFLPRHECKNVYAATAVTGLKGNKLPTPRNVIVFVDFDSGKLNIKSNDCVGTWLAKAKLCDVNVTFDPTSTSGRAALVA